MPTITEFHVQMALYTAILPGLVAAVLLAIEFFRQPKAAPSAPAFPYDFRALIAGLRSDPATATHLPAPSYMSPMAVGFAVFTAYVGLYGWPDLPIRSAPAVAIVSAMLGLLGLGLATRQTMVLALSGAGATPAEASKPESILTKTASRAISTSFLALAVLITLAARHRPLLWGTTEYSLFGITLVGFSVAVVFLDLATAAPVSTGWWVPLVFVIAFTIASAVLGIVASVAIYAQMAAAAATACGVAMLIGIFRPKTFLFGPGGSFAAMVSLAALIYSGWYFGNGMPEYIAILTVAAPVGIVLVLIPGLGSLGRWIAIVLAILIPGIPLALFLLNHSSDNAYGY